VLSIVSILFAFVLVLFAMKTRFAPPIAGWLAFPFIGLVDRLRRGPFARCSGAWLRWKGATGSHTPSRAPHLMEYADVWCAVRSR
jgi:hypothetical protein